MLIAVALAFSTVSCNDSSNQAIDPTAATPQMNLNDLTVNFADLDSRSIITEWHWLTTASNVPILITLAGDAFLQNTESGAVSFLNTAECSLTEVAPDYDGFQSRLRERDFVMEHFCVEMMGPLLAENPQVPAHQLYSLKKPLLLGGEWDASNLELADLEVHFSILGQVSRQVRDLPPGTAVGNVTIKDE